MPWLQQQKTKSQNNGIPPNFECSLEVYSYLFENEVTSLPRKLKKTIHSSISRTVGRKLAATLRDELTGGDLGPKFDLVASAKLHIDNVTNNVSTYDLSLDNAGRLGLTDNLILGLLGSLAYIIFYFLAFPENSTNQLPLYGHFCCRLAAQPDCYTNEKISGFAKVPESDNANPSWCRIFGWRVEVWESKEDAEVSPHHPHAISLDKMPVPRVQKSLRTMTYTSRLPLSTHIALLQRWGLARELSLYPHLALHFDDGAR
ncbi:unnamed protein product [Rotaria socialis]|uniref:Anillin homology domain-containing protein n=1 Tax=Rotaria socialis TaxID=392032 RepID=A0A821QSZ6_9BILA|nr:unnamed protein product [Rotaria socialis]